jgi:hypothetical protein
LIDGVLYPMTLDEVLAVQERKTLCIGSGVPDPLNESTGEFEALLTKETVPEAAPVACGVNATVTAHYCRWQSLPGRTVRLLVNSELLTLAGVTATLAPVALSAAGLVLTTTLPNPRLARVTPNCPAAVPVPDSEMFRVGFDAFEVRATFPLALPAESGVKVTVKVILCPDVRVNGGFKPVTRILRPTILLVFSFR